MHPDTVSNIKWRPRHPTQITACSAGIDARLCVWDLDRPFVPYATFDTVSNKYHSSLIWILLCEKNNILSDKFVKIDFIWRSPDVLVTATRERLFNEYISNANLITDMSESVALNMDKYGSIAFAIGEKQGTEDYVSF